MKINWDDLRLFLDVARSGGLTAAGKASGLSPATLGRRVSALERQVGERLFVRTRSGYRLTAVGEELLDHARGVETAMRGLDDWRASTLGERVVRVSAGPWTSSFVAAHFPRIWSPSDRFRVEFVTASQKVDIGHRHADIGVRNARPTEQWLAGRLTGHVASALYGSRSFEGGVAAGMFIGQSGEMVTASARWVEAHHADRIVVRGNDAGSIRELVAAGAGLGVLPCFIGDADGRLARATEPIEELATEQWLVSHHDERHHPAVRKVADRLAALFAEQRDLLAGRQPGG